MKKLVLIFAVIFLFLTGFNGIDNSFADEKYGDFSYLVNSDSSVTITSYSGSDSNVVIPNEIDGKKVTGIGHGAFEVTVYDFSYTTGGNLNSIVIPEGVTFIGYDAFKNCEKLESISMPKSITDIGDSAFKNCIG
ncbi:MAG: leucine-rich repeat protein, partial [Intestinibacter sp.]|uniref:leucine-rich repeat protein n=1 Tax=Intestinibacter sp. TaxID=1965304 RepID=UPI003F184FF0